jgi:photosystem II PsbU protein
MSKVVRALVALVLVVGSFLFTLSPQAQALNLNEVSFAPVSVLAEAYSDRRNPADEVLLTDYGQKIDLNNANVRLFRELRGFYPTLAQTIVKNAPYDKVEDVLNISGLSDKQKERLQANLQNFTVTDPASVFLEGDDRFNNGNY